MTLGLKKGSVRLVPHSEEWDGEFKEEQARIVACLHCPTSKVSHVGSTAVPGIPAKPIIDIAVGVPDLEAVGEYARLLKEIGYEYRGDRFGDDDHLFVKGPAGIQTHYLHLVALSSVKWRNYALFRDYLRSHERTRREYAALKRSLAENFPSDRESYTQGKHDFIRRVIGVAKGELVPA